MVSFIAPLSKSVMESSKEMSDISQQSPPEHTPATNEEGHSLLPQERLKRLFLAVPLLSLLVGGALLLTEVTVIVLVLVAPTTVGISEELALTKAQRGVLGAVSIIMLIEAVVFGIIDIGIYVTIIVRMYMELCLTWFCKCNEWRRLAHLHHGVM